MGAMLGPQRLAVVIQILSSRASTTVESKRPVSLSMIARPVAVILSSSHCVSFHLILCSLIFSYFPFMSLFISFYFALIFLSISFHFLFLFTSAFLNFGGLQIPFKFSFKIASKSLFFYSGTGIWFGELIFLPFPFIFPSFPFIILSFHFISFHFISFHFISFQFPVIFLLFSFYYFHFPFISFHPCFEFFTYCYCFSSYGFSVNKLTNGKKGRPKTKRREAGLLYSPTCRRTAVRTLLRTL